MADEIRVPCIEGHRRWLDREPTSDDEKMYSIAKNNMVIDAHIAMDKEESVKWKVVYENGYAVKLEKQEDDFTDYPGMPGQFDNMTGSMNCN